MSHEHDPQRVEDADPRARDLQRAAIGLLIFAVAEVALLTSAVGVLTDLY
ncbi:MULTISPECIES: hypothetical protein [Clavibacter]|jgi:hypothetical protein|nr:MULTISPECIES: hypothetical protein [Clavibacter]MBF4622614.1 hypothetical protein [Clavibacter sp. VKM Ac-2542]